MISSRATKTVVGLCIHLGHHGACGLIAHGRVGKMLEADDAVHQRAGEHILDAEFAIEAALRIGPVGVLQPAWMRPRLDALDALRRERMRGTQMQHGVGGRMRRAAARMALEGDARVGEIERLRPFGKNAIRIEIPGAVEHRKEALLMLERTVIGRHALLRQQRGEQTVARGVPDMKRLGLGAEVGLNAGGHGSRERERGQANDGHAMSPVMPRSWSMIRKSGYRFSEKIMLYTSVRAAA